MRKKGLYWQNYLDVFMLALYLFVSFWPQLSKTQGLDTYKLTYFVIPSFWCIGIFLYNKFIYKMHAKGRLVHHNLAKIWAFFSAGILIVVRILAGIFIDDFGTSPYEHSIVGIVKNLYYVIPGLVAKEYVRSYCVNKQHGKRINYNFLLLVLIFSLIEINLSELLILKSWKDIAIFTFKSILPIVVNNIYLNLLSMYVGSTACIIYMSILVAFEWLFPILPMLSWISKTVIDVALVSLFGFGIYDKFNNQQVSKQKKGEKGLGIVMVLSVALIWFFAGVFSVYPSVVLTGSMEPYINPGDMVLIKKVTKEEDIYDLKIGDVLNFSRDTYTISHRITDIKKDELGNISFQTKGDNNPKEDKELVIPNDIKGIIVYNLPKAGTPILWLRGNEITEIEEEVNQP